MIRTVAILIALGLVGQEPGASGTVPTALHGMGALAQANRIYFGYGTNSGGILQIVDRANNGMHILELTGPARDAANFPK